jgi:predicted nucleotidyltransferase
MKPELTKDFRDFIASLEKSGVRYVLIGGYAVAWHGHPRYTKDIDFLVEKTEANAEAIVRAFEDFGLGSLGFQKGDFLEGEGAYFGLPPYRVDLLNCAPGINFEEAWETRIIGDWDGLKVNVLCLELLIRTKRAAGRGDDLADIAKLLRRAPR